MCGEILRRIVEKAKSFENRGESAVAFSTKPPAKWLASERLSGGIGKLRIVRFRFSAFQRSNSSFRESASDFASQAQMVDVAVLEFLVEVEFHDFDAGAEGFHGGEGGAVEGC